MLSRIFPGEENEMILTFTIVPFIDHPFLKAGNSFALLEV